MVEKFKQKLKNNGQSLKWFYDTDIKECSGLTYGGFCHQLNGYSPLSEEVKRKLEKYLEA